MVLDKWLKYAMRFNLVTICAFLVGGIQYYSLSYRIGISVYVVFCLCLLKIGYGSSKIRTKGIVEKKNMSYGLIALLRVLGVLFVLYTKTRGDLGSLFNWISGSTLGELYFINADSELGYGEHWSVLLLRRLIQLLNLILFAKLCVGWEYLKRGQRFLVLLSVILEGFYWVSIGTNIGMFQLLFFWLFFRNKTIRVKGGQVLVVLGVLVIMNVMFESRLNNVHGESASIISVYGYDVSPMLVDAGIVPTTIYRYLTEGYYFLGDAFTKSSLPYSFKYVGYEVLSLSRSLGLSVDEGDLIQNKIGDHRDAYAFWHSCYTWYANFAGFFATPFIFFLHGRLLRYNRAIYSSKGGSLALVTGALLILQVFLLVANNHLLSFWVYEILWLVLISTILRIWQLLR